ncbi:protein Niban 2a [Nerophis lumbriciformis]|uniref:protein Niban 2a n=1 Tax=Nerophis lumbriciformis TaxID=546530 RepID=UPI003BABEE6B
MGDVVSSHLDESKREMITVKTKDVMRNFSDVYEQQYAVALFNSVRYEIEGGAGPQSQMLHRKDPLAGRTIFSGCMFQYLEENRKWRNRFVFVPNNYAINLHESKTAQERGLHPKVTINCAGYKALTSMEEYMELINSSLPGIKSNVGSSPFIKCATQFPLILWHPYARHHYFCVLTEKEQQKWHAVLQDCVRHCNNGLPEDCTVQTPAFTDTVRLYRQAKGHYGTWDMMCGTPPQILTNLVLESLHPELRNLIGPRLKGKTQQRQRNWMFISDAVYRQVLAQTSSQYDALLEACETQKIELDSRLRTNMDQIIASKEHVSSKIRALVLPKAEALLRRSVQTYISSILEALMEPTSRGFAEVRDVFFREVVEISKNLINGGGKDKMGEHMERLSMLAFHPVKMQSCYEKVEELNLEGLQQRFDVSSPSVFVSRAQILMGEQMDNAVHTFEQLLQQSLTAQGDNDLCKTIQGCQDRVLKKYDYDSSTIRKKFFREALLQIIIPYMLQQLSPSCTPELPHFKELIFEDFSRFLLVENMFEEVVLQSVTKDIMMAVKEAAVQRRHNLYRDSIVMTNSDPNLHLLGESSPVDWATKFPSEDPEAVNSGGEDGCSGNRRKQVVSMIQMDGVPLPYESCLEVPGVELIPEEDVVATAEEEDAHLSEDNLDDIKDLLDRVVELDVALPDTTANGTITLEDGVQEEVSRVTSVVEDVSNPQDNRSPRSILQQLVENKNQEADKVVVPGVELIPKEGAVATAKEDDAHRHLSKDDLEKIKDLLDHLINLQVALPDADAKNQEGDKVAVPGVKLIQQEGAVATAKEEDAHRHLSKDDLEKIKDLLDHLVNLQVALPDAEAKNQEGDKVAVPRVKLIQQEGAMTTKKEEDAYRHLSKDDLEKIEDLLHHLIKFQAALPDADAKNQEADKVAVPGVELIPQEGAVATAKEDAHRHLSKDDLEKIKDILDRVIKLEVALPNADANGTITLEDGVQEEVSRVTSVVEDVSNPQDKRSPRSILQQLVKNKNQEADKVAVPGVELIPEKGAVSTAEEVDAHRHLSKDDLKKIKDLLHHLINLEVALPDANAKNQEADKVAVPEVELIQQEGAVATAKEKNAHRHLSKDDLKKFKDLLDRLENLEAALPGADAKNQEADKVAVPGVELILQKGAVTTAKEEDAHRHLSKDDLKKFKDLLDRLENLEATLPGADAKNQEADKVAVPGVKLIPQEAAVATAKEEDAHRHLSMDDLEKIKDLLHYLIRLDAARPDVDAKN